MSMERILVLGCPGSGKSTLSNFLGERLRLPVVHLDQLWWMPGWVERSKDEFDVLLAQTLQEGRWVIDGNFARTLPMRLPVCDTVFFLDYSRATCLWSTLKRTAANWGHPRADMPEGCPDRLDPTFLKFIWDFKKDVRPDICRQLKDCGKDVHVFNSRRECNTFFEKLEKPG